jgi:phosphomannomutase
MRIDFEDGWILVRRSGTSPILRVSGEHKRTKEEAKAIIDDIVKILKEDFDLI